MVISSSCGAQKLAAQEEHLSNSSVFSQQQYQTVQVAMVTMSAVPGYN
jgi:hypothetical protein